jgi:hypothetical protein
MENIHIEAEYTRPGISIKSIMITVNDFETQPGIWSEILSLPPVEIGDLYTTIRAEVNDGRGNIFIPLRYQFSGGGGINLYCPLNEDAPIKKFLSSRGKTAVYSNAAGYIVRDKVHQCWKQWEEAGFAMLDPKPMLNKNRGNGNYFFFVHPISMHGVLWEFISMTQRDKEVKGYFDWTDTEINIVSPDVNP